MDLGDILADLRREREAIDAAIRSLERLVDNRPRGPGRPASLPSNHSNGRNGASQEPGIGQG